MIDWFEENSTGLAIAFGGLFIIIASIWLGFGVDTFCTEPEVAGPDCWWIIPLIITTSFGVLVGAIVTIAGCNKLLIK